MRPDRSLLTLAMLLAALGLPPTTRAEGDRPPNFVVIVADNLGYGDIGPFGSTLHRTPHLDRMAEEGMKLTNFYVSSGVCSPSRASIMTGCYPRRVNLHEDATGGRVLRPVGPKGLHPDEVTIAEVLRDAGYATACIGKWHLGDQPPWLPTRQGFDHYFGIPYSDDMTRDKRPDAWPELPLLRGEEVIEAPADRNTLVKRCTEEAIAFIRRHRDRPFFVYLPHTMPGSTPHPFASEAFRGKSANGPYGDSVEELDWSTGAILAAIDELGLDEQTLVLWTSDNGAPRRDPPQGSNRPLGGWGYSTMEGGMRVPCLARWPGRVPAGSSCDEIATTMDLLPTLARLAGTAEPQDRTIDGKDIRPLLLGEPGARSPHEAIAYYDGARLAAVRSGRWKLHLPGEDAPAVARLYDLDADLGETTDVAGQHPEAVDRLLALAERFRDDLGDAGRPGADQRPAAWVDDPRPLLPEGVAGPR